MDTWQTRIEDLQRAKMTLAEIGAEIGLSTSAVGDLATGRTKAPGGDAAVRLYELHQMRGVRVQGAAA